MDGRRRESYVGFDPAGPLQGPGRGADAALRGEELAHAAGLQRLQEGGLALPGRSHHDHLQRLAGLRPPQMGPQIAQHGRGTWEERQGDGCTGPWSRTTTAIATTGRHRPRAGSDRSVPDNTRQSCQFLVFHEI